MSALEQCLLGPCRSPIACDGWGYCRERNNDGLPTDAENVKRRRAEALAAIAKAEGRQ